MPECEKCGETFDSSAELGAHTRWSCEEYENETQNDNNSGQTISKSIEDIKEPESDFYKGKAGELEVIDFDKPKSVCPECSDTVRPGKNCESCGEELDWS